MRARLQPAQFAGFDQARFFRYRRQAPRASPSPASSRLADFSVSRPSADSDQHIRPEPLVPRSSSRPVCRKLRKEEAAAVAQPGVVILELVAVIAQRQWLLETAGDRHEAAEMLEPLVISRWCRARCSSDAR